MKEVGLEVDPAVTRVFLGQPCEERKLKSAIHFGADISWEIFHWLGFSCVVLSAINYVVKSLCRPFMETTV